MIARQQPNLFEQLMQIKMQKAQMSAMEQEAMRNRLLMSQAQQRFPLELESMRNAQMNADRAYELQRAQEQRAAQEANTMNPLKSRLMQYQLDHMPQENTLESMKALSMLMEGMGRTAMNPTEIQGVAAHVLPDYFKQPSVNDYMAANPAFAKWNQLMQQGKIKP